MSDYEFIKNFTKIKLPNICKKVGCDYSNLISGRSNKENYTKVKELIISEFSKLLIKNEVQDETDNKI